MDEKSIQIINEDCMNVLKDISDNYFDLAIVDPPYRDAKDNDMNQWNRKTIKKGRLKDWNNKPTKEYFDELFRVSKNQIIWGANNFELPQWKGFVCWKKKTIGLTFNMSMVEIASLSENLGTTSKWIELGPQALKRVHPTQKPVALYRWLLENYANPNDKILDTHLGSGSSAIAAHYFGINEFLGIEINKEYFDLAKDRFEKSTRQLQLI